MKATDSVTFLNLLSGMIAIVLAFENKIVLAALALIAAVIFDFSDGYVVRTFSKPTKFGMYLDSFADIISFCIAPAMIAFLTTSLSLTVFISSFIFVSAGVYRLSRFQVKTPKNGFEGMPITLNGIFFAIILFIVPESLFFVIIPAYFLLASLLMVSTFRVRKIV